MSTINEASVSAEQQAQAAKPGLLGFLKRHPTGFWFIFWGEFAERCSYYGMRGLLVTYMVFKLRFDRDNALQLFYAFVAGCYILPLVGGYLADNFFGKYKTIVWFSAPYILGHVILGVENSLCLYIALALLAMGSGVIKPNISTLMGLTYDQERPGDEKLRSAAFSMFYMAINIGAAISQFALPPVERNFGYQIAFLLPAILMVVAFALFAAGKPYYAKEIIQRRRATPEETQLKWRVLGRVGGIFALCTFFWAIFDQSSGSWLLFAYSHMNLELFGWEIDPRQMQALNPVLIVALLPLVTWLTLRIRPTNKMLIGFALTAACMGVMAYAGVLAGNDVRTVLRDDGSEALEIPDAQKVTIAWQVLAYVLLTVAEILISVTGLELAFVAAPKNMKSFVTSLWLVTVFLANAVLNTPLASVYTSMHPGTYFAMLAAMMVAVTIAFAFESRRFNRFAGLSNAEVGSAP